MKPDAGRREAKPFGTGHRGGMTCSSEEVPVMGMERRGHIVQLCKMVNRKGGAVDAAGPRMKRPNAG